MAEGLQCSRWLCCRWPFKELQRSVGDDNAGGGCGSEGGGLATVMVSAAMAVERKTVAGVVSAAEQS